MKRIAKSLVVWLGVWLLCAFLFTFLATHRLRGSSAEPTPTLDWGTAENHRLKTSDGEELGAWFVDHPSGDRPAVIFLHGVGANRLQLVGVAEEFHRRGCPVLLVTQRTHGDSTGCYNDFGCSGGPDLIAAVDWLRERTPGRKVIVWGTSMGAATALFGAEAAGDKVAGYILECPYQNLRVATRNRTQLCLPPGIEAVAYHTLQLMAPLSIADLDALSPEDAAARMPKGIPVLIFAGENDRMARPEESHAIAARVGCDARVRVVPDAGHTVFLGVNPELVRGEIDGFLEQIRKTQDANSR